MNELRGAALVSYLQKQGKEFSREKRLKRKRKEFERMKVIVQEHERLTALDLLTYRMNAYAGIAMASVKIVFYVCPCLALAAVTVKAIHWIVF